MGNKRRVMGPRRAGSLKLPSVSNRINAGNFRRHDLNLNRGLRQTNGDLAKTTAAVGSIEIVD